MATPKRDDYDAKMARELLVAGGDFAGYFVSLLALQKVSHLHLMLASKGKIWI